jgi:hypothetical protein
MLLHDFLHQPGDSVGTSAFAGHDDEGDRLLGLPGRLGIGVRERTSSWT